MTRLPFIGILYSLQDLTKDNDVTCIKQKQVENVSLNFDWICLLQSNYNLKCFRCRQLQECNVNSPDSSFSI